MPPKNNLNEIELHKTKNFSEKVDFVLGQYFDSNNLKDLNFKKEIKKILIERMESLDMFSFDFENKKVLDLASGWPIFPMFLKNIYKTADIKCIDLNVEQDYIDMMGDNYICGDVTVLPFSHNSFDTIISTLGVPHIFLVEYKNKNGDTRIVTEEYINSAYKALLEAYRCLKVGGSMHLSISKEENIEKLKKVLVKIENELNIKTTLKPLGKSKYVIVINKN